MGKYREIPRKWLLAVSFVLVLGSMYISYLVAMSNRPARMTFTNGTEHYYGVVEEGEGISYAFVFRNDGGSPLRIKKVKTGCACTDAKAKKLVLEPGETSEIVASYTGRRIRQREVLQIWVETNDLTRPITTLLLGCDVHLKVFWHPKTVSFYHHDQEKNIAREVRFLKDSAEEFEPGKIQTSSQRITAKWGHDDKGIKCIIGLNPECPKGNWADKVTVGTLVGGQQRDIHIPVNLMIR